MLKAIDEGAKARKRVLLECDKDLLLPECVFQMSVEPMDLHSLQVLLAPIALPGCLIWVIMKNRSIRARVLY